MDYIEPEEDIKARITSEELATLKELATAFDRARVSNNKRGKTEIIKATFEMTVSELDTISEALNSLCE